MSGKDKPPSTDNPIKNLIQDAYGMSTRECLKEFQDAEEHPDLSPELQAPSNGYQRIKDIIDLEGIPSAEETHKRKVIRLRRIWRPLVAVAVVGSVIWGFGIGASGQKFYGYRANGTDIESNNIVWDNDENFIKITDEDKAYSAINEKLGIVPLKLSWKPYEMKFEKIDWASDTAILEYTFEEKQIYFIQAKANVSKSDNYFTEHDSYKKVPNEWLKQELNIGQNETPNGALEYDIKLEINGVVYYLVGIFENEEDFEKIVGNLSF